MGACGFSATGVRFRFRFNEDLQDASEYEKDRKVIR